MSPPPPHSLDAGWQVLTIHTPSPLLVLIYAMLGFILFSSIVRLAVHAFKIKALPESAVLILAGAVLGGVLLATGANVGISLFESFSAELFFLVLIPPIIFEAGFSMDRGFFFGNLGLILLYAVLGTLLNTIVAGLVLWATSGLWSFQLPLTDALAFGSLMAAVDPVSVLAIFETVHVNETLYSLVFGESLLNDAVSIVLYHLFVDLRLVPSVDASIPFLAILKFLIVSVGGILVGVLLGFVATFLQKFSGSMPLLQPVFPYIFGYLSYLVAETIGMSGIMAILFSGVFISRYIDCNMVPKCITTLHVNVKLIAGVVETIVFMYLGISAVYTVSTPHHSDWGFIWFTVMLVLVLRSVIVFGLTALANLRRVTPVDLSNQTILAYSGVRGAVAFCLAVLLPQDMASKQILIDCVLVEVLFSIFVQGGTIKFLLAWLHIKRAESVKESQQVEMQILPKIFDPVSHAIKYIGRGSDGLVPHSWVEAADSWAQRILLRDLHTQERELVQLLETIKALHDQNQEQGVSDGERKDMLEKAHTAHEQLARSQWVNLQRLVRQPRYVSLMSSLYPPEFGASGRTRARTAPVPKQVMPASQTVAAGLRAREEGEDQGHVEPDDDDHHQHLIATQSAPDFPAKDDTESSEEPKTTGAVSSSPKTATAHVAFDEPVADTPLDSGRGARRNLRHWRSAAFLTNAAMLGHGTSESECDKSETPAGVDPEQVELLTVTVTDAGETFTETASSTPPATFAHSSSSPVLEPRDSQGRAARRRWARIRKSVRKNPPPRTVPWPTGSILHAAAQKASMENRFARYEMPRIEHEEMQYGAVRHVAQARDAWMEVITGLRQRRTEQDSEVGSGSGVERR